MLARIAVRRSIAFAAASFGLMTAGPLRAQLAPPPEPPENPVTAAKAVLGKILFWDEQLSSDNTVACGTCHRPSAGGGDVRFVPLPGPDGRPGTRDDVFGSPGVVRADADNDYEPDPVHRFLPQVTGRASPSFVMAAYFDELFWDGRAPTTFLDPEDGTTSIAAGGALESQMVGPPLSGVEMAHAARDWSEITAKLAVSRPLAIASDLPPDVAASLALDPTYPDLFESAFGDSAITAERIAFAVASYERTLIPDQAPWDLFAAGDSTALSPDQQAGLALFEGKANCSLCHVAPEFTDGLFHNIGLRDPAVDPGRQDVTGDPGDRGKFKTPSLRDVGLRLRVMHTGEFADLGGVIGFYDGGGVFDDNLDPLIVPLDLAPPERAQLRAFLEGGLDDPRVALELPPFDRPTLHSESGAPNPRIYGLGSRGSGGFVPALIARTPPNLGNVDWKLGLSGGLGGAPSLLALAGASAPPGTRIGEIPVLIDFTQLIVLLGLPLHGAGPGAGYQTLRAEIPADPALLGLAFFAQWFVIDSGAAAGVAASNGAEFDVF